MLEPLSRRREACERRIRLLVDYPGPQYNTLMLEFPGLEHTMHESAI